MNGGRTSLDVSLIEGFTSNLKSKRDEINTEYQSMRDAVDALATDAFKGDIVSSINEAMSVIEQDKNQIENVVTRFIDFLESVKKDTIERDQAAAQAISNAADEISTIKK